MDARVLLVEHQEELHKLTFPLDGPGWGVHLFSKYSYTRRARVK